MKKKKGGGGGGANWMDTYGDMVTLLLCIFVLLYSMSTISEDKWKALVQSFNPGGIPTNMENIKGGDGPSAEFDESGGVFDNPDAKEAEQEQIEKDMEELYEALKQMVGSSGLASSVQVTMQGGKVYVSFNDTVFFKADKAEILPGGQEVLAKVSTILESASKSIDEIRIQGHTAQATANKRNEPRGDYRLSFNRAMEVMLFIQDNTSIAPARMISEGMGQWRPRSSNATGETRAANRRVELIISGRDLDAEEFNKAMEEYLSYGEEGLTTAQDQ